MNVLVLGGTGFIGRHAVAALQARGDTVTVGTRHPGRARRRFPQLALQAARLEQLGRAEDWGPRIEGFDAVVNCVGILRQRGRETYTAVHAEAPAALARACRARGLRLVHVSALALQHPHRSRFLRSKREGERRLREAGADLCLVRPSLLDGEGGFGARWIRGLARLPLHAVPRGARGRIAALDVGELGEALAALAHWPRGEDGAVQEFDFGGPQALDIGDYLQALRIREGLAPARQWRAPDALTRAASHLFDLLHLTPLSFGHWELLRHDNLPTRNRLAEVLGRAPRAPAALSPRSPPLPHRVGEPCTEAPP
jgi:uncharacterized protein YbjT (DUF2867 family)